jgi:hypothetical protein
MAYHKKHKHTDHMHKGTHYGFTLHGGATHPVGGEHTFHTEGPGCWMDVPQTKQQPKAPEPPTGGDAVRMHHKMARPYGK